MLLCSQVSFSLALKNDWKWLFNIEFTDCVVPEDIHTSPLKGLGLTGGVLGV